MCSGTCEIMWVDLRTGQFTPDSNPAVGYASFDGKDFFICAEHLPRMPRHPSYGWSFTPFSDLAL